MLHQFDKATAFQRLHARPGAFVIPNPWDAGTARLLAGLGFEALATTSAGFAFTLGRIDSAGAVSRDEILANAEDIAGATDLPVTADLEDGFGAAPETVAETIRRAAAIGLVGGSIEDAAGRADDPIHDFGLAVERVRAAVEAARSLPFPFVLTARADNFLYGRPDLADTIRRLQAYQEAGADVLYAPGVTDRDGIATLVRAVDRPVNMVTGLTETSFTVAELTEIGVKRISVGGSLARAALGAFLRAARVIRDHGSFSYAATAIPDEDLRRLFSSMP
ncbi:isocitrate lyase/PEP mutase family protein [Inquilinus sp. CA228]|uniref:isocitrate lyase/PEP mutase family protein n=1 Tax=Inquilinus sp. CA228 TaxID=3455609 RepID=UPI003F8D7D42